VHWDGTRWTDAIVYTDLVPYPKFNGVYVAAPDDAWATAENLTEPLFHYTGSASGWRVVKTPGTMPVYGVHGIAGGGAVWAYGLGGAYRWNAATSTWATDASL